jgi:hypothetical protein
MEERARRQGSKKGSPSKKLVLPVPDVWDDEADACLLACYRLLMEIAEREGYAVWETGDTAMNGAASERSS